MPLYDYLTPKLDFKRKFNHRQSFLYKGRLTVRTIWKFRTGSSVRIESRIGSSIRTWIESRSFAGHYSCHHIDVVDTLNYFWPAYTYCRGAVLFCCLASVIIVCNTPRRPAGVITSTGQAMTSCRLPSNYSSTVTLHGGPVVLRHVRAIPC